MADKKKTADGPMFRCKGIVDMGASADGNVAFIMLEEINGRPLTLAFPAVNAQDFASRFLTAGDLARATAEKAAGKPASIPAPFVTDHEAGPSGDGQTLVLTLKSSGSPLVVRMSKSRSEKVRASLEKAEGQLSPAAANSNE